MGISNLRFIDDDTVAPDGGFATYGQRVMDIVREALSGVPENANRTRNGSVIRPSAVQRIGAVTGITHSEYNLSPDEPGRFLQIGLPPTRLGIAPEYAPKHFPAKQRHGQLCRQVSPDSQNGSINTRKDAPLCGMMVKKGTAVIHATGSSRTTCLQVAQGSEDINGERLESGIGVRIDDSTEARIEGLYSAAGLLLDLP